MLYRMMNKRILNKVIRMVNVIEGMNVFDVEIEELIDVLFEEYRNGIVDEMEFVESYNVLNGEVI